METRIFTALGQVRQRQRIQSMLAFAAIGLFLAGLVGIGIGVWKNTAMQTVPAMTWFSILIAGPIVGLVTGAFWHQGWKQAASAVDTHYELKDRSITALSFINSSQEDLLHKLQVEEAGAHLAKVKAGDVVPFRLPRTVPFAVTALGIAVLLLIQNTEPVVAAPTPTNPRLLEVRDELKDSLTELLDEIDDLGADEETKEIIKEQLRKSDEIKEENKKNHKPNVLLDFSSGYPEFDKA